MSEHLRVATQEEHRESEELRVLSLRNKSLDCAASLLSGEGVYAQREKIEPNEDNVPVREWRTATFSMPRGKNKNIVQIMGVFYRVGESELGLPQRLLVAENVNCRPRTIKSWGGNEVNITNSYAAALSTYYDYTSFTGLRVSQSKNVTTWLPFKGSFPEEWLARDNSPRFSVLGLLGHRINKGNVTERQQWKHICELLNYATTIS